MISTKLFVPETAMLVLGGLDPSGGAGILLDCRAALAAGVFPATVVSLRTIQDGVRFVSVLPERATVVEETLRLMTARFRPAAVKVGALGTAENVDVVVRFARANGAPSIVLDPVLGSTSGGRLVDDAGLDAMRRRLLPHVTLVTPNLDELAALTGIEATDAAGMRSGGEALLGSGAPAVLVKGGHLPGPTADDLLLTQDGLAHWVRAPRHGEADIRGTGCAYAAIIAALLARGMGLRKAVELAKTAVTGAIASAFRIGDGPPFLGRFEI